MKKVAIIMSVYKNDREEFLKKAIESILNQTYENFDLYIQCDGIIPKECRDYLYNIKDSRVSIRERKNNKGLALSLQELLKEEVFPRKYEYIARMDADDISLSTRIKKQVDFLNNNKTIDVVGTWITEINNEDKIIKKIVKYPLYNDDLKRFFKKRDPMAHVTVMFRNTFFSKAGNYRDDLPMAEDTLLWYYGFLNKCNFANIPSSEVLVRRDKGMYERRSDWNKSIKLLKYRLFHINKNLNYGLKADLYAIAYFFISISPSIIKKIAYKLLR